MSRLLFATVFLFFVAPRPVSAANILLVSDSGDDLGIATALMADGHTVTTSPSRFAAGSNPALLGDLSAYDVVYWSQDGTGAGDAVTNAMLFTNLTDYINAGGRVFVTGYDSVASPSDPMLTAFLGATGSVDVPGAPGAVVSAANSLTTGVVDIRGVTPTGGAGDLDALTGLSTGTVAVCSSAADSTEAQWTLRTLGAGEIAYVSNGNNMAWTVTTGPSGARAYNAAVRNFAFNAGGRTTACMGADGSACTVPGTGDGLCYGGVCCAGCWDATAMRCRSGRSGTECGAGGALCASCSDGDLCTSDVCTAGVCSNPDAPSGTVCDDGAYCTATDRCDGAGACVGTGTPCDDGRVCTTDSCSESGRSCTNMLMAGVCNIGGMCVPGGTPNPTNGCQVCDAARSTTAWSSVATGTRCGTERCSAGRYFPPGACSSAGICEVPAIRDCPTGMCAGTICEGACTAASCPTGTFCSASTLMCEPLIADGGACSLSATCASGFCVDNVCCMEACDGLCSRCGSTGRCALIPSGGDPDRECAGDNVCDGAGMCRAASVADAGTDAPVTPDAPVEPLDAGVDAPMPMDAGPEDAGTSSDSGVTLPDVPIRVDGGTPEPTRRGCSCRVASPQSAPGSLLGLILVLGLALLRRRR